DADAAGLEMDRRRTLTPGLFLFVEGDFRTLPPSAWEALHARFRATKIQREEKPDAEHADAPVDTTSQPAESQDPALTEAPPSPESDWWLALCVAVQQNLCKTFAAAGLDDVVLGVPTAQSHAALPEVVFGFPDRMFKGDHAATTLGLQECEAWRLADGCLPFVCMSLWCARVGWWFLLKLKRHDDICHACASGEASRPMSAIGQSCGSDPRLLGREALDARQLQPKSQRQELEVEKWKNKVDEVSVLQPALGRFRALVGGAWQRVQSIFRRSSSSGTAADEEDLEVGGSHDSSDGAENESKAAFFEGDFRTMPPSAWEALSRGLDLLHILQSRQSHRQEWQQMRQHISRHQNHCGWLGSAAHSSADPDTTVTTKGCSAPGHDRSITKNGSKSVRHARFRATKIEREEEYAEHGLESPTMSATDLPVDTTSQPAESQDPALTEAPPSPESGWWLALCVAVQQNLCCGRVDDLLLFFGHPHGAKRPEAPRRCRSGLGLDFRGCVAGLEHR
ncbi:unnamed protein product, partial [Symbiodinium sp. KB8]